MQPTRTDVIVIGAGPIGIELAVALKQAGIDYVHFDAKQIAWTISWFAPQTRFFSSAERLAIAGVPLMTVNQDKPTREEYLAYLRAVVRQFDLKINTYEPVVGIERRGDDFLVTTRPAGGDRDWLARRIVLCTGGTAHPRKFNIPGEDLPHVSHYFQDPHTYFDRELLVVGGKNSAVEAALRSHHAGAKVTLSYRREQFNPQSIKYWLLPEINGLIQSGAIRAHFETEPVKITPAQVALRKRDGKMLAVPADFVLALIGYEQDKQLLRLAGVELAGENLAPVLDEHTMETNVPGIYVAGTAVAGTQTRFRVFIENCHVHVDKILAALTGSAPPPEPPPLAQPES